MVKRGRESKGESAQRIKEERYTMYLRRHKKRFITMLSYARQALKEMHEVNEVTPTIIALVAIAETEKNLDHKDWEEGDGQRICRTTNDIADEDTEWHSQLEQWYRATAEALDREYARLPKRNVICAPYSEGDPFVVLDVEPEVDRAVAEKRKVLRRIHSVMSAAKNSIRNPPVLQYNVFGW